MDKGDEETLDQKNLFSKAVSSSDHFPSQLLFTCHSIRMKTLPYLGAATTLVLDKVYFPRPLAGFQYWPLIQRLEVHGAYPCSFVRGFSHINFALLPALRILAIPNCGMLSGEKYPALLLLAEEGDSELMDKVFPEIEGDS